MRPLRTHHGATCWVRVDDSTGRVTVEQGDRLLREELEELKYEVEAALAWLDERDEGETPNATCLFCENTFVDEWGDSVCDRCYAESPRARQYVIGQAYGRPRVKGPALPDTPQTPVQPSHAAIERWQRPGGDMAADVAAWQQRMIQWAKATVQRRQAATGVPPMTQDELNAYAGRIAAECIEQMETEPDTHTRDR